MLKSKKDDTLGKLLDRAAMQFPKNEAIVQGDKRITYDTYMDKVNSMANALLKLGVKRGDKVAIWMANIPEWVYAHFAAVKLGAAVIPINTRYKVHELEYILKKADVTTLFLQDRFLKIDFIPMIYEVLPELKQCKPNELKSEKVPLLKRVIMVSSQSYDGMLDFNKVLEMGKDYAGSAELKKAQEAVKRDDVYIIPFTSGTTGVPKGVVTTHDQYIRVIEGFSWRLDMTDKERILVVSPFNNNMGNMTGMTLGACHGACILPMLEFDPGETLRMIHEEKATRFVGAPTMYIMMMDHPDFPKRNTRSLKRCIVGGSDVAPELVRAMIDKMGIEDVIQGYGMTENSGISTCTRRGDPPEVVARTAGKLMFEGCDLKILDPETGKEVPRDTQGEICTKGWFVMKEYYKMPEETKKAFDKNGWFHTGDLGVMDEKDYIKITGRIKDMFITGGLNAYPAEIESFFYTHPKVAMVAVIGVPDRRMQEVGMAFIKLKEGQTGTAEEFIAFARDKMANYKAPKYIKFVTDFPMTPTGKVQKFILKEQAIKEMGQDKK